MCLMFVFLCETPWITDLSSDSTLRPKALWLAPLSDNDFTDSVCSSERDFRQTSETTSRFNDLQQQSFAEKRVLHYCYNTTFSQFSLLLVNGGLQTTFRCIPPPTVQECVTSCHFKCARILILPIIIIINQSDEGSKWRICWSLVVFLEWTEVFSSSGRRTKRGRFSITGRVHIRTGVFNSSEKIR